MICTSCNIHDDLAECPSGQQFRFIYDKTISGGNAFGAQVGYVSLYVFDQNGDYITTLEDYGSALDENAYRMQTNLSSGTYNLITWCRQTPEETAFEVNDFTSFYDMEKTLITDNGISDANLPASWNANTEEIEILNDGGEYTVSLTRNTNNVRVVLQQINGSSVDPADFDFTILGKSKVISGSDNLPYGDVNYKPYTTGQSTVGGDEDGSNRITVAYAEFSTSRLMVGSNARLQIDNQTTDKTVMDIPLIDDLVMRR